MRCAPRRPYGVIYARTLCRREIPHHLTRDPMKNLSALMQSSRLTAIPVSALIGFATTAFAGGPPSLLSASPATYLYGGPSTPTSSSFGTLSQTWSFPPNVGYAGYSVTDSGTITGGLDPSANTSVSVTTFNDSSIPPTVFAGTACQFDFRSSSRVRRPYPCLFNVESVLGDSDLQFCRRRGCLLLPGN